MAGPGDGAEHARVAHFQVGGAVRRGRGADLCGEAAELIPAPAVEAEESEGVGGGIEWHFRWWLYCEGEL